MSSSLQSIGTFLFGDENNFQVIYTEEKWHDNNIVFDFTPNPNLSLTMTVLEERYKNENALMDAITIGDRTAALNHLSKLLSMKITPRTNDQIRNMKNQALILNVLCRKAAEKNFIHPVYLDEISTEIAIELEKLTTRKAILDLMNEMVKKYCLFVQNQSLKNYSPLVRRTLNYINFNLSKTLSLKIIADEFNVNPNYLSTTFKKEVDITLTEYINSQRINLALKLLNTSDMQIQDIAWYVGINDVNYFTKLFKKKIGHTPSEYKKKIKSDDI